MHELYIAESIIASVKASLPPGIPPETVRIIEVKVGALDAVIPDNLLFLFDAIRASHRLSEAALKVVEEPLVCRCETCGAEIELELPIFLCDRCGSRDVKVVKGRGVILQRIVADDPQSTEILQ